MPLFGFIPSGYPGPKCKGYNGYPAGMCIYKIACVQAGLQYSSPGAPYLPYGPGTGNTLEDCLATVHPEADRSGFMFAAAGIGPAPDFAPLYNVYTPNDVSNPTRIVYKNVAVAQWIPNLDPSTGGRNDINPQYGPNSVGAPTGVVIYDPCTGYIVTASPGYVDLRSATLAKLPFPDVLGVFYISEPTDIAKQVPDHNIGNPASATNRPKWVLGL